MPPLFSSTNVTTLLRKVVHAARYVHPRATVPASKATRVQRARNLVSSALHETYTSLSTSGTHSFTLQPLRNNSSGFASSVARLQSTPLSRASRSFRMEPFRSVSAFELRGAARVANVGLGSARTFATSGSCGNPLNPAAQAKASMVFRAIADHLRDDHNVEVFPRPTRYASYKPSCSARKDRRRLRTLRRVTDLSSCSGSSGSIGTSLCNIDNVDCYTLPRSLRREFAHYFPRGIYTAEQPIELPPRPEHITTPGWTTTLLIPLDPSDEAFLMPTTDISFNEVEIGVTILSNLTGGVVPIMEAFSNYRSNHVIPLLAKLESLGIMNNPEIDGPVTDAQVVYDKGLPLNLEIVFQNRSEADVRRILGGTFSDESSWFTFIERKCDMPEDSDMGASLAIEAEKEWNSPSSGGSLASNVSSSSSGGSLDQSTMAWSRTLGGPLRPPLSTIFDVEEQQLANTRDLKMPSLGLSGEMEVHPVDTADVKDDITPPETMSWISSRPDSPISHLVGSPPMASYPTSPSDSLFEPNASSGWSQTVSPSEADSDIAGSFAPSEGFSDELISMDDAEERIAFEDGDVSEVEETVAGGYQDEETERSVNGSWVSAGNSFDADSRC